MPIGARFAVSVMPVAAVTVQAALGADPKRGVTCVTKELASPTAASWTFSFVSPETGSLKVTVQLTRDRDVGLGLARTIDWATGAVRSIA